MTGSNQPKRQARERKWYEKKAVEDFGGSRAEIDAGLSAIPTALGLINPRYRVSSIGAQSSGCVASKTVLRTLRNGHYSAEIHVYVNTFEKRFNPRTRRNEWVWDEKSTNWVIDLDKTRYQSCAEVLELFKDRPLLKPSMITTTSTGSYHLVITGGKGVWTRSRRIEHVCKIFGIQTAGVHERFVFEALKAYGVDIHVLLQEPGHATTRITGTLNHRKHLVKNSDGSLFTVKTWINKDKIEVIQPTMIEINELRAIEPEKICIFWYHYISTVSEMSNLVLKDKELSMALAKMLCNHFGWLKAGRLQITQTKWAEKLGIDQPKMSRVITLLCNAHILRRTVDEYKIGKFSKSYGLGFALISRIEFQKRANSINSLPFDRKYYLNKIGKAYEPGQSNDTRMADVMFLHREGVEKNDIIDFCYRKQVKFGKIGDAYYKEIIDLANHWFKVVRIVPRNNPPPDLRASMEKYLEC